MAISDDFSIDLTNRRIYHSSGTTVYQMYQLYAWLMDYFDESTTIDDTIPMTAQTLTDYTLTNGWFLDYVNNSSHQYLKGGSLKSLGWNANTYNYGIRIITFAGSYTPAVSGDIGRQVGYSGGSPDHTGTLLAYNNTTQTWWVRVDDTGDTFSTTGTALDLDDGAGTGTGTISTGTNLTGENIWANPYTIGTLTSDTSLYLVQNASTITSWWSTGHIDILLLVQEAGTQIDEGYATIAARQYSKLYDHFITDLTSGARTPIPLATFADTNNTTGYNSITLQTSTGTWNSGNYIYYDNAGAYTWATTTKKGVLLSSGSGTTPTLEYYLIGDLTDFVDTDEVTEYNPATGSNGDANGDVNGNPVATTGGPADSLGITITFSGAITQDINNGNGTRPYDCTVNCNGKSVATVYQYFKYITMRGYTSDIDSGSLGFTLPGEQYTAVGEQYFDITSGTGSLTEGNTVTGDNSGATATIVSNHSDANIVVRDIVGVFETGEGLTEGSNTATLDAIENIAASKQSPFGTFAGGKLFGARGVYIYNMVGTDSNNYVLTDSTNTLQTPPSTVAITISNTQSGDRVSVFQSTGTNSEIVNKTQYSSHATNNTAVGLTFEVDASTPITADTPSSGSIRIVNAPANSEERLSYSSWTGNIFTLTSSHSGSYDGSDYAYVPYIDEQATSDTVSVSVTYDSDKPLLIRVRIKGMQPFQTTETLDNDGVSVRVIRNTDSNYTP